MHPEPTRAGSTGPMRMRCVTWTRRGDAEPMDAFTPLAATFSNSGVLYVVIGAWGANYYAPSGGTMFMTLDRDIFRRFGRLSCAPCSARVSAPTRGAEHPRTTVSLVQTKGGDERRP